MDDFAPLKLHVATLNDSRAVTELLTISYTRLLAADYGAGVLGAILPSVTTANRALLGSGRFYVVRSGEIATGCGGWSAAGRARASLRHFATHPAWLRMGVGRLIMQECLRNAELAGARWVDCAATLGAVPFYQSFGFRVAARAEIRMGRGIRFPVAEMLLELPK